MNDSESQFERDSRLAEAVTQSFQRAASRGSGGWSVPRPHQVDAVACLVRALASDDAHPARASFLVQHAAGSGKSLTIAALTERLLALRDTDGRPSHTVLIVNDRRQLDEQLAATVISFLAGNGHSQSAVVRTASVAQLRRQLAAPAGTPGTPGAARCLLTTVQKLRLLWRADAAASASGPADPAKPRAAGGASRAGRVVVIADEAHRHHGAASTAELAALLEGCAALSGSAVTHSRPVSFVAFTATPSVRALRLFGVACRPPPDTTDSVATAAGGAAPALAPTTSAVPTPQPSTRSGTGAAGWEVTRLDTDQHGTQCSGSAPSNAPTMYRPAHCYSLLQAVEDGCVLNPLHSIATWTWRLRIAAAALPQPVAASPSQPPSYQQPALAAAAAAEGVPCGQVRAAAAGTEPPPPLVGVQASALLAAAAGSRALVEAKAAVVLREAAAHLAAEAARGFKEARAMLVARSRRHVVWYTLALRRLLASDPAAAAALGGEGCPHPAVYGAFSGCLPLDDDDRLHCLPGGHGAPLHPASGGPDSGSGCSSSGAGDNGSALAGRKRANFERDGAAPAVRSQRTRPRRGTRRGCASGWDAALAAFDARRRERCAPRPAIAAASAPAAAGGPPAPGRRRAAGGLRQAAAGQAREGGDDDIGAASGSSSSSGSSGRSGSSSDSSGDTSAGGSDTDAGCDDEGDDESDDGSLHAPGHHTRPRSSTGGRRPTRAAKRRKSEFVAASAAACAPVTPPCSPAGRSPTPHSLGPACQLAQPPPADDEGCADEGRSAGRTRSALEAPGLSVSEAGLNGRGASPRAARLLVVCGKYETGWDDPRLTLLFVDRVLSGARAVQTLGRISRPAPHLSKRPDSLRVLDFVNTVGALRDAFSQFCSETTFTAGAAARRGQHEATMDAALSRCLELLHAQSPSGAGGAANAAADNGGSGIGALSVAGVAARGAGMAPERASELEAALERYCSLATSLRREKAELPLAFAAAALAALRAQRAVAAGATTAAASALVAVSGSSKSAVEVEVVVEGEDEAYRGSVHLWALPGRPLSSRPVPQRGGGAHAAAQAAVAAGRPLAEVVAAANEALAGERERVMAAGLLELCSRLQEAAASAAAAGEAAPPPPPHRAAPTSDACVAAASADAHALLSVLRRLELWPVSAQLLRLTNAGRLVNALRKHPCPQVAALAAAVVAAWKRAAARSEGADRGSEGSAAARGGASGGGELPRGAPSESGVRERARSALRSAILAHFAAALGASPAAPPDAAAPPPPSEERRQQLARAWAAEVEGVLHAAHSARRRTGAGGVGGGSGDWEAYKARVRALATALRQSDGVARELVAGRRSARQVAAMDARQLAPAAVRRELEAREAKQRRDWEAWQALHSTRVGGGGAFVSTEVVCPACGERRAEVHSVLTGGTYAQERVPIQKCVCQGCQHTWRADE